MGNEPPKRTSQSNTPSEVSQIPYTSYSVSNPQVNGKSKVKSRLKSGGIINVSKERSDGLTETEYLSPHVHVLKNMATKPPLLPEDLKDKSSIRKETKETHPNLDFLNSKPIIDLLAEFQTNSMRKGCVIMDTQKILFNQMDKVRKNMEKMSEAVFKRYHALKEINENFKNIDYIYAFSIRADKNMEIMIEQLKKLEQLLPAKVRQELPKFPKFRDDFENL